MKYHLLIIISVLFLSEASIVPFNKQILVEIYQQNKVYLIYVHDSNHDFSVESIFNSHCFGQKLCTTLEPTNPDYHQLREFIGYQADQYFLIFDPSSQRKYILDINSSIFTDNDLLSFEYKYLYKEIQPFFASQSQPTEINLQCTKLVGKNVGEFLRREERVKVIFLYNLHESCKRCENILLEFIPFAEKHYQPLNLSFGYYNTFLNDNPVIQDEKTPSFLVFIDQQLQTPFQLEAEDLSELSYFLSKTLGKHFEKISGQAQAKIDEVAQDL